MIYRLLVKATVLYLFIVLNFLSLNLLGQQHSTCGFEHKRQQFLQDPANRLKSNAQEFQIERYSNNQSRSSNDVYTVPVVVHVLHLGENIGEGTNISDAQIQSSIDHLNQFYRGETPNSSVDFKIEFKLAQQDPDCNTSIGINRIDASTVPNYSLGGVDYFEDGGEADENVLKDLSRWSETDFFNIWIVSEIENNDGGYGIQGYANFFAGYEYEGSMMMYNVFGYDPNNQNTSFSLKGNRDNSTVTHEIGHYLHLHHTFKGDGDADNDNIGDQCPQNQTVGVDSDGCDDTEPHKRYTSECKSGTINECTGSTFGDNTAKNIMSYSSCQDRLTEDQKTRARAMLSTSGTSLIYSIGDQEPIASASNIAAASCAPQTAEIGLSGGYGGIMEFSITDNFSYPSSIAASDGGYLDVSGQCLKAIQVEEDTLYEFNVSTWLNAHNIKGYIDYNNDGDFNDQGEQIFDLNTAASSSSDNLSSVSTDITIPTANGATILANTPLRLRINADLGSVSGPCHEPEYGQIEDYLLVINQANSSCDAPSDLSASNINSNSADLSWTAGGSEISWDLSWGVQGFSVNAGTQVNSLDLSNYTLTGLSENTAYDYYVSANCGSGNVSYWSGPFSFTTLSSSSGGPYTLIPDPNFEQALIDLGYDDVIDGQVLTANISGVESLGVSGQSISDLTGIEDFTALTYLSCSQNQLTNLDVSQNTALTYLECYENQLTSLDISQNYLYNFFCNNNQLTCLNLKNNDFGDGPDDMQSFGAVNNPNLTCIEVDDPSSPPYSEVYDYFDDGVTFSTDCNYPNDCFGSSDACETTYSTDTQTACDSFTWIDGNTYSTSNSAATTTLINTEGCDSIVTLDLIINNSSYVIDSHVACNNFTWIDGITYNSSNNSATYTTINNQGCDSIVNLDLIINNSYFDTIYEIQCDSFNWNNQLYTSSGLFIDSNLTVNGCDSINFLNLSLNYSNNDTTSVSVCDTLFWNNNIYTTSGFHSNTFSTTTGCDSIVTISLSVSTLVSTPLTLQLILDDYCLETSWHVKDSYDSIWQQEGPFNCNPNGGGEQANDTLITEIYLPADECFTFNLNDSYGDGMSASNWGGIDGSWKLTDFNGLLISEGSGNFGYSLAIDFVVDSVAISNIITINNDLVNIKASPNPFNNNTLISVENLPAPYDIQIIDLNGKIVREKTVFQNKFSFNSETISQGIYLMSIKNQPNLKPLKLVIE